MRIRSDVVLFVALLAGSAYAVSTQIGHDPMPGAMAKDSVVPFGGVVPEVVVKDLKGADRALSTVKGKAGTVLYFFSADCPCVEAVQPRLHEIVLKYQKQGIEFVAIDGSPDDTAKDALDKASDVRMVFMRILSDPEQKLVRTVGVIGATDCAVLDGEGRLVYRGTLDDGLVKPTKPYLAPVLEALVTGKEPPFRESAKKSYGCVFPGFQGDVCELK